MTLSNIRDEVWARLGEDTTFDPTDDSAGGSRDLLDRIITEAYRRVVSFTFPDGRQVRFRALYKSMFFTTSVIAPADGLNVTGSISSTTAPLDTGAGATDGQYNEWVIEMTSGNASGEIRLIVDYVGATKTATVNRAWGTTPADADTYKLYKRWWQFVPSTHAFVSENISLSPATEILAPIKVSDVSEMKDLGQVDNAENFTAALDKGGASPPSSWFYYGTRLTFNTAYNTARYYRVEYVGYPEELTRENATDDVPVIPVFFHDAIVQGAVTLGHLRAQEIEDMNAAEGRFITLMSTIRSSYEHMFDRLEGQTVLEI